MMLKKSLASLPRSLVLALLCAGAMAQASAQTGTSRIGFVATASTTFTVVPEPCAALLLLPLTTLASRRRKPTRV